MRIIVASTNPVKIDCARRGFARVFPDETLDVNGVSVPSGVTDQPMTDAETLIGASNRAANARAAFPDAEFWVGIEGGVQEQDGALLVFAWIVVLSPERQGRARSGTFVLPDEVAQLVHQGYELGYADDAVFGRSNSKQQNGSVGILTRDLIDRADFYTEAVILALIPFMNPALHFRPVGEG